MHNTTAAATRADMIPSCHYSGCREGQQAINCYNAADGSGPPGITEGVPMTPVDASALALLARKDRRLTAAMIRADAGRLTSEDADALPPREPGEPLVHWACRCRASKERPLTWQQELAHLTREAHQQLERAAALHISAITIGQPDYPPLLAAIADPPPILWTRGDISASRHLTVAVVGSRAATPYALTMARQLSMDLSSAGITIVSGLARGVDSAAHRAVVSVKGRTIGVLGCGVDAVYPPEAADLARQMELAGAIVSEFPAGTPPLPHHFPMRNRIISGLSAAVVVIEASEKSGALITASAAAEQGRDVLVLPGQAIAGRNRGGHLLIRDGAKVVETANDVLEELAGAGASACAGAVLAAPFPRDVDFTVDDVAAQTGEPPNVVLARLLELELAGQIQRMEGGRFVRVLT
jgi:DNA processing protein